MVAGRLPVLTRYRQKVRFVPGGVGRPVWVADPHFDLQYHVRHTALPPPGGEQELNDLMGRLMSVELDRSRPLWEAWMVEGLAHERWALISKVHHCMVDGVSGTDLMVQLLDPGPEQSAPMHDSWAPPPEPLDPALTMDALIQLAARSAEQLRKAVVMVRRPGVTLTALRDTLGGMRALGEELSPTPALSIEGTIGSHRRWAAARSSLDEIKEIRRGLGGTVNDVVLTAITGAFRDLLLSRGDNVEGVAVRSLVPVNVRQPGDLTANNQVSAMLAELPVGIEDPVERLEAVQRHMATLKASHQAQAGEALTAMADLTPPALFELGVRTATAVLRIVPQRTVNTVTTNVPGPPHALYAAGREMLEYLPFVPLSQGVRIGVAILSYNGHLAFGVTGDLDTVPEVEWFCRRIEVGIAELRARAAATSAKHPEVAAHA